jgi:two-component system response regulator NreC
VTRVLIADNHALVRSGLRRILEAGGIEVVGEAESGEASIALAKDLSPEIVLMDLVMPGISGLEATVRLKQELPGVDVIILTVEEDAAYLRASFAAGAVGYLIKNAAEDELLTAVREVALSGSYVHPRMGARLLQAPQSTAPERNPVEREIQIMRQLALGHTNAEAAAKLSVSVRTVEIHRLHIFQKLGINSRAELVQRAIDAGLLPSRSKGSGSPAL